MVVTWLSSSPGCCGGRFCCKIKQYFTLIIYSQFSLLTITSPANTGASVCLPSVTAIPRPIITPVSLPVVSSFSETSLVSSIASIFSLPSVLRGRHGRHREAAHLAVVPPHARSVAWARGVGGRDGGAGGLPHPPLLAARHVLVRHHRRGVRPLVKTLGRPSILIETWQSYSR